jgi:integrase
LKDNTKHIYLRTLRSLYNKAIDDGFANSASYPFLTFFKGQSFDTETEKKAITSAEVEKIRDLGGSGKLTSMEAEAWVYFMFGYYGMGINFVDIAHLKWTNIKDGKIVYRRKKLSRKKKQKTFSIPIKGKFLETCIREYRKTSGIDPDNYIFPILQKEFHKTPQQQHDRIQKVITRVNRDLKTIGAKAGIKKKLSTYTWRHTAFTVLKLEKNIPIAMISQAAGHSSVAVTEIYLDSFGADQEEALYDVLQ